MERKKLLIGLTGKPHAGKTEIAKYLQSTHGFVNHIEMSDAVIAEASLMLSAVGLSYSPDRKSDYRLLLQFVGHFRRIDDPDYWLAAIDHVSPPATIGGIRYVNEIARIHQLGGVVWKVVRDQAQNSDTAPTETQLDNFTSFDAVIDNNRDLPSLYRAVDSLIASMRIMNSSI